MIKTLDLEKFKHIDITQRDNELFQSKECFPSSAAIAIDFLNGNTSDSPNTANWIVNYSLNLSDAEKLKLMSQNNGLKWIDKDTCVWNSDNTFKPFQCIPIMEYICRFVYPKVYQAWRIQYSDIIDSIDRGIPVVCLGNFSPISYVGGHYGCIVGYNTDKNTVIDIDPWGNGHTNYSDQNGFAIEYDWNIFIREQNLYSYGLWFK